MINSIKAQLLLLILFLSVVLVLNGQTPWKLEMVKNGIEIYTRETPESKYKEFKAIAEIDNSFIECIAVMHDINNSGDWMHLSKEVRLLEEQGDTLQIYYNEAKAPWPFKNRDAIYVNTYRWKADSNTAYVHVGCLPDYLPEINGLIRVKKANGLWKFVMLEEEKTRIIFKFHVEPGGNIPSWLANSFVTDSPYSTLMNFKAVVDNDRYKNKVFSFIQIP
jgi:hypothetical protein